MKKLFYLFVVLFLLTGSFFLGKKIKKKQKNSPFLQISNIEIKKSKELPIAIIVINHETATDTFIKKCFSSIKEQDYQNYQIYYANQVINDVNNEMFSDDFFKNKVNISRCNSYLESLYNIIHQLPNGQIVVLLDPDSWFASKDALKKINQIYQDKNVWMTIGESRTYPSFQKSPLENIISKKKDYRNYDWHNVYLKSFYVDLFKKIAFSDFLFENDYMDMCFDNVLLSIMLEMADKHSRYVKDVLAIYNEKRIFNNGNYNEYRYRKCKNFLVNKKKYSSLKTLFNNNMEDKADIVIFSYDRPLQLHSCLESIYKNMKNFDEISVVLRTSDDRYKKAYDEVQKTFPKIVYFHQGKNPKKDFKPLTMKATFDSPSKYIIFCVDDIIIKSAVDLAVVTKKMKETKAFGFFLRLGKNTDFCYMTNTYQSVPKLFDMNDDIYAWNFTYSKGDWAYIFSNDMTVYKKNDLKKYFEDISFINTFELEWKLSNRVHKDPIGLCFGFSKMINIPLNIIENTENRNMNVYSLENLLEKFLKGYKIDIGAFDNINNKSSHMEYEVKFIKR